MSRKIADCRRFESDSNCSLTIIGEEDEVIASAPGGACSGGGRAGQLARLRQDLLLRSEDRDRLRGLDHRHNLAIGKRERGRDRDELAGLRVVRH